VSQIVPAQSRKKTFRSKQCYIFTIRKGEQEANREFQLLDRGIVSLCRQTGVDIRSSGYPKPFSVQTLLGIQEFPKEFISSRPLQFPVLLKLSRLSRYLEKQKNDRPARKLVISL